jgi:hypothetical protein
MGIRKFSLMVVTAAFVISSPVFAEPTKTEAVITNIEGNTISARTMNGPITVILTPSTTIAQTSGIARKTTRDAKALIPA